MKFDELDARMRVFETAHDLCVLPGLWMVVRLDGRGFTRLTREVHRFQAPFDERFRDLMVHTTRHLMDCGLRVRYGYTQSDEISLLVDRAEQAFGRTLRKLESVLAGEASAAFALALGAHAAFDARVSQLPSLELVVDYFRWRSEDAHRNALHGHCYWALREDGLSVAEATRMLSGLSVAGKNELLFQRRGVNFNDVPRWQRRGVGLYWARREITAQNRLTGEPVTVTRRALEVDLELPMRDAYDAFVRARVDAAA